jgi:hypothetical protein
MSMMKEGAITVARMGPMMMMRVGLKVVERSLRLMTWLGLRGQRNPTRTGHWNMLSPTARDGTRWQGKRFPTELRCCSLM